MGSRSSHVGLVHKTVHKYSTLMTNQSPNCRRHGYQSLPKISTTSWRPVHVNEQQRTGRYVFNDLPLIHAAVTLNTARHWYSHWRSVIKGATSLPSEVMQWIKKGPMVWSGSQLWAPVSASTLLAGWQEENLPSKKHVPLFPQKILFRNKWRKKTNGKPANQDYLENRPLACRRRH